NLYSALRLDPHDLNLNGLRLSAFGGELSGDAALHDFAQYKFDGKLQHLDIQTAARVAGEKLPYDGIVSGPINVQGDLKAAGTQSLRGNVRLAIAPGRHGIPMSGRLMADYNGATGAINVGNSYIALPHTRLNLSGSIGNRLNIELTT